MPPRFKPNRFEPQAITVPTAIATRPAGTPPIANATEPTREDDGEADHADEWRHEHVERRTHRDKCDGHAGQRPEQSGARRDSANDRCHEAADHQNETLNEHPGKPGFPSLNRDRRFAA